MATSYDWSKTTFSVCDVTQGSFRWVNVWFWMASGVRLFLFVGLGNFWLGDCSQKTIIIMIYGSPSG